VSSDKHSSSPILGALAFQAGFIPLALFLAWLFGVDLRGQFWLDWQTLAATVLATAFMFLFYMAFLPFGFEWARRLEAQVAQMMQSLFQGRSSHWALPLALAAGVGEELLFRGVIQAALGDWLGTLPGLVLASILFGLAHCISLAYFLIACLMGLFMGALYLWSGNLLLPILVHALYDWLAFLYYLKWRGVEARESSS